MKIFMALLFYEAKPHAETASRLCIGKFSWRFFTRQSLMRKRLRDYAW